MAGPSPRLRRWWNGCRRWAEKLAGDVIAVSMLLVRGRAQGRQVRVLGWCPGPHPLCARTRAQVLERVCREVQAQAALYQESVRDEAELADTTGVELGQVSSCAILTAQGFAHHMT